MFITTHPIAEGNFKWVRLPVYRTSLPKAIINGCVFLYIAPIAEGNYRWVSLFVFLILCYFINMINICIVEDEVQQADLLKNYIEKYGTARNQQFNITHLLDGIDLVDDYKSQFDIILLDIQMKHLDGMAAAEKIRKVDADVIIIFITSTVQYAVQGYAVDALGYVLKPVPYTQFEQLFDKAITRVQAKQQHVYVKVNVDDKQLKLDCDTIIFIESQRNNVIIHCEDMDYTTAGPLKRFDEMLESHGFSKCHNAYLINLSFVEAVQKEEVILTHGINLPISRARKKEFMAALTEDIL